MYRKIVQKTKKAIALLTTVMMVVWSMGLSLIAPFLVNVPAAHAAAPTVIAAMAVPDPMTGQDKEIMIHFSGPVTKASALCATAEACAAIYTVSGPISVMQAVNANPDADGSTTSEIRLSLAGPAENGTTTLIIIDDVIVNESAEAVTGYEASPITLQMQFQPVIEGIRLADASTTRLVVTFDREMLSTTTNTLARYSITTADSGDNSAVTAAALQTGNKVLWVDAAGATIADGDSLMIMGMDNITSLTGDPLAGPNYFVVDGTKPRVVGVSTTDNVSGGDYAYIRFNERMDRTTAETTTNYTLDPVQTVDAADLMSYNNQSDWPSWMSHDQAEKIVRLTVADVTAITESITVSTNVTDMAGNAMDTTGAANVASFAGGATSAITIATNGVSGTMVKGSWGFNFDGCTDTFGDTSITPATDCTTDAGDANRDTIAIVFTGAIDPNEVGVNSSGVISNVGGLVEIYEAWSYGTIQSDCSSWATYNADAPSGQKCTEKNYANLDQSYGKLSQTTVANDTLTIYLQGWTWVNNGMYVNPNNVRGINGLTALQNSTMSHNQLPWPTFAEVEFVKADKTLGASASVFDANDTITIFFSADMDRTDIATTADILGADAKLRPQKMMPWQEHVWGTTGAPLAVAWGNYTGTTCTTGVNDANPDCLKITLGNNTTVAEGDEIMSNNLTDLAGNYLGWAGKIDTTAPTATATLNTTTERVMIVFSEEMVELDGDGDYSNNEEIVYTGTAEIDTSYDLEGFTAGIKLINEMDMGDMGTMTGGWVPIKKFALQLDDPPEDTDTIAFTGLTDEGGLAVAAPIGPEGDTDAPTICKVIQNDWDNNGNLNAWDEIIFIFDSNSAVEGCQTSDLDYSSITNPNTDFIIKRAGSAVTTPFGSGAGFWVDQWDRHAGEFHINLGQGADIRENDVIWAAEGEVLDMNGNVMAAVAQKTIAAAQSGEISQIEYTDNGLAGLTHADVFKVIFSAAIDPYSVGTYDGTSAVTNLDWGLPLEFNWDMNFDSAYTTWSFKTWGSASTGEWNGGKTELTITIDCSAGDSETACDANTADASFADGDRVQTWNIQTADGTFFKQPGMIDMSSLSLTKVAGLKNADGDGESWGAGDKLLFMFSEPVKQSTLTTLTAAVLCEELVGSACTEFGGDGFAASFPENSVLEVTLGADTTIDGTEIFNPAAEVTDQNGNADATAGDVFITTASVAGATSVVLADNDSFSPGIDGRDITITWDEATGATEYKIYIIPNFVRFDSTKHNPIAIQTSASACSEGACTFTGGLTETVDSRSMDETAGIDWEKPFFPFSDWDDYTAWIIAKAGTDESFPSPSNSIRFGMEWGSDGNAPWVEDTMPWNGARDILLNQKKITIRFNKAMSRSSIETAGNILLEKEGSTAGEWSIVSSNTSYDDSDFLAVVTAESNLTENSNYRVRVTTNVTGAGGTALGSPFETHFSTGASSDSTGPKVRTYFFDGNTITTGILRATFSAAIEMNEDIDPSSITSTSVTLSPAVSGSTIDYDPFFRAIVYNFGAPLAKAQEYTLTLSGVYIKDPAGNTLDGDGNGTSLGTTSDNYTLTFTTENEDLDTTNPIVNWIDSDGFAVFVGISQKMEKSAVEKKTNWTLKKGTDLISLQTASFFYDQFMNELRVEGVNLTQGDTYTLTPNSSVVAMNGQSIDTTDANHTSNFTVFQKDNFFVADTIKNMDIGMTGFDGGFNGDMFMKMGTMDNFAEDKDFKMFMPVSAWPMNQTANKTTNYHINFPTTKAIPHGGTIILEFPASFDITNAALATDFNSELFFFNRDINGPGGASKPDGSFNEMGKVQISNVSSNNQTKKITLTLAVDDGTGCVLDAIGAFSAPCTDGQTGTALGTNLGGTMPFDFIDFELKGIKNGNAASIDWFNNTGGYTVGITSKDNNGKKLEGPLTSMRFDIKKAGAGSISGKVTTPDGSTGIQSAEVFLDSPMAGHQETTTNADGDYSFSGLPVEESANAWGGWYHVMVEAPRDNADYFGGQGFDIQLTTSSPTSSGNNVSLSTAANTVTFTITYGADMEGKQLNIWAGGPNGWKEKKITLADGSAGSYIDSDETIKVSDGTWDLGIMPYFDQGFFGPGHMEQDFMPPPPKQVNVSGPATVAFTITSASLTIKGSVLDNNSNPLSNVQVYSYDPSGNGFGSNAQTGTDGKYTLKVAPGTYIVGANKPGMPGVPEQTVDASANVTGVNFRMVKPTSSISGSVSDGANAIQWAGVNAWTDDGKNAWSDTDAQGDYTLFLGPGIWHIDAHAPGFGKIEPSSATVTAHGSPPLVTVAADTDVTGVNFSLADTTFYTISGTVTDSGTSQGIANVFVSADEVFYSGGAEGGFTGNANDAKTDSTGAFTIKVKANTAGTGASATRYRLGAWNPEYGDLKPASSALIDASSANSTGNSFSVASKRKITVSILNADLLEVDTGDDPFDITEAFVDIFSMTNDTGNHKRLKDIELTAGDNTAAGSLYVPQAGGYTAHLHIPGVGGFDGTLNTASQFAVTADSTVVFDLNLDDAGEVITISGTTTDGSANLSDVWVNVTNQTTYETFGVPSAADGTYSMIVPAGTYKLRADKPGYKSPAETTVVDDSELALAMELSGSTIAGTVTTALGAAGEYAFVWAEEVNGNGWVGDQADENGDYTLAVPEGTDWKIYSQNEQGATGGITTSTPAGTADKDFVLATSLTGASQISNEPKIGTLTPSQGGVVDDTNNTGVKLTIPENALGTGRNPGQIQVKETAALPKTTQVEPFGGVGKQITATDSESNSVTSLQTDVTVALIYDKEKTEVFADATDSATENGLEEIDKLQNSYWDSTTQTWVGLSTTKTAKVKDDSTDTSWTVVNFDTFITNITGEDSNPSNAGADDSGKDYYYDYQIILTSKTDHFTIFAPTAPPDGTPPATPTGLAVLSAQDGSVSLDWSDNTEGDLGKYDIYRGTTAGFTCPAGAAQLNSSVVRASAFADLTVGNASYTYYYKVSATDTGGLESACTSAVTASFTAGDTPGGGSSGGCGTCGITPPAETVVPPAETTADTTTTTTTTTTVSPQGTVTAVPASATAGTAASISVAPAISTGVGTIRLVKSPDSSKVYLVKDGRKVWIPNEKVFLASGFKWSQVQTVASSAVQSGAATTKVIKSPVNAKVYEINSDGSKTWIPNEEAFMAKGYKWSDVVVMPAENVSAYTEQTSLKEVKIESPSYGYLNVRSGEGTQNARVSSVEHGAAYNVLEEKNGWYKIEYEAGKTGWIHGGYTSEISTKVTAKEEDMPAVVAEPKTSAKKATVAAPALNFRSSPEVSADNKLGTVLKGEEYEVLENNGNGWIKIKKGETEGWVSERFTS